ncbi:MAG TPA: ribose-phosphate pyrophosphokinase [Burkholderiaceae bacterium]|nr:ribose-phosphate pyrophosphokinase [Burkholderiaceae bacterium]
MKTVIALIAMPGNEQLADALATALACKRLAAEVHRFPDGESKVRLIQAATGRDVGIVCTLDRPDDKFIALFLMAHAARESGARRVGLIAPYLPYMRQDQRFHNGETISAQHVASWISSQFDWLITVDPHLHRIKQLGQIYTIPNSVVQAAPELARWIQTHIDQPLLIGPDEESEQWAGEVAALANAPHVVLTKTRLADRQVRLTLPSLDRWRGHTPVLVDDIISTAQTMIEALRQLSGQAMRPAACVAIHAIFAQTAYSDLQNAGAHRIATTNTIVHPSNQIRLDGLIAQSIRTLTT